MVWVSIASRGYCGCTLLIFISAAASLAPPLMHLVRLHEDITRARAYVRRSMSYSCATVKLIRFFVSIFSRKLFISLNNEGEGPPSNASNVNRLVCGGSQNRLHLILTEGGICRAGAHGRLVRLWPAPNFPGKSMTNHSWCIRLTMKLLNRCIIMTVFS